MKDINWLLNHLLSLHEWEWYVEFKTNFDAERDGKNLSALSNTALLKGKDFWYLVFGVEDKTKNIIWTNFDPNLEKKLNQPIKLRLSQKITPKTHIEFYEVEISWKKIVIVEISSANNVPVKFDNVAYVRIGESTTNLSWYPDLEKKIWNNNQNKNFEKWIALENITLNDVLKLLDYDKYFQLTKQTLPSDTKWFLEKMEQDKLVIKQNDGKYSITVLWAISFARNINDFPIIQRKSIRVITYNADTRAERKTEQDWIKWYAIGFEPLLDYVLTQTWSNEEIKKAMRITIEMYPKLALREFIANAIIHQDFSLTWAGPMIEIFSNRIEITNPGSPLIDVDRFIDHPPRSRNEDLASLMRRIGFCEESWSGIDRALINIELYQLPAPKFETYQDFTKVTLYAPKELKAMTEDDKVRACYQHCVLRHLQNWEKMTNKTLRERLNIPESNYPAASKIISITVKKWLIKEWERPKEYVPWWA